MMLAPGTRDGIEVVKEFAVERLDVTLDEQPRAI